MKIEKVVYAALLHDIGKIVLRSDTEKIRHEEAGRKFLTEYFDNEILTSIQYHHKDKLEQANLNNDDIAYIIYEADNISSALDRRIADETKTGFNLKTPLYSVFNILNGNNANYAYELLTLKKENPVLQLYEADNLINDPGKYFLIRYDIKSSLDLMKQTNTYNVNSFLKALELASAFVPSSTNNKELADISLFNHSKTTAMIATNIYKWAEANNVTDYKKFFFKNPKKLRDEKIHLLLKGDVSGIQNFIYRITDENALKSLRARSIYLEFFIENLIDELITELGITRANLIYNGGGAFQLLVPNTQEVIDILKEFTKKLNFWMIKHFQDKLYIAIDYVECSSNDLTNNMEDTAKKENLLGLRYKELSKKIGLKKLQRYNLEELKQLTSITNIENTRECKQCKTSAKDLNDNSLCSTCASLINLGKKLQKYSETFLIVTKNKINETSFEIFGFKEKLYMSIIVSEELARELLEQDAVRVYTVNQDKSGLNYSTNIMYGGSEVEHTLEDLAKESIGNKKLGVLRMDVDDLSQAFIRGFDREDGTFKYNTISRTTTLSYMLTLFFKNEIRKLATKQFSFNPYELPKTTDEYALNIIYSGGDDLFLVGPWNQVLEFSINLNEEFNRYTANTLTLSAGFSLFDSNTPILTLANEAGNLETEAKVNGKNRICLFTKDYVLKWDELTGNVLPILKKIYEWFSEDGKGKMKFTTSFYELRILLDKNSFNISKFAYKLTKLEEQSDNEKIYNEFKNQMMEWARDKTTRKYLHLALTIAIYLNRKDEKNDDQ